MPPQRVTSGWTRSTWPRSISSRKPQSVVSCSPAATRISTASASSRVGLVLVRLERLLEPEDAELLELRARRRSPLRVGAVAEARVDQDRRRPRRPPRRPPLRSSTSCVGVRAERPPAELDGGEALLARAPTTRSRTSPGVVGHQHRGVGADPVALRRPDQLADRLAGGLALDVPERDVDAADRVQRDRRGGRCRSAPRYILCQRRSTSSGSSPTSRCLQAVRDRVRAGRVDERADGLGRRVDLADAVMPSSVWTRTTRSSWLPSAIPVVQHGLAKDHRLDVGDLHASSSSCQRMRHLRTPPIVDYNQIVYNRARMSAASPVHCTLDLDAPGKQFGRLELPRSTNTSGWSHLFIPIVSIRGGDGPTAVVFGGVHGDEPEGQVAALQPRARDPGRGRSGPADRRPVRLDRGLARLHAPVAVGREPEPLVPGLARTGRPTSSSPTSSAVSSSRAPTSSSTCTAAAGRPICPPWSEMHWVDDPEQRRQMVEGMLAWNTDVHFVYIDIAGTGLLVGEAERQGKIVVSTELGGGGQVTAATHRVAASGLANVLRHFGVLAGEVQTRESLGLEPAVIVRATEIENYLLAPDVRPLGDPGRRRRARRAGPARSGAIHFIDRPDREPTPVHAANGGFVCARARDRDDRPGRQRRRDRPRDRRGGAAREPARQGSRGSTSRRRSAAGRLLGGAEGARAGRDGAADRAGASCSPTASGRRRSSRPTSSSSEPSSRRRCAST